MSVAHTQQNGIDVNEDGHVLATPGNMEEYSAKDLGSARLIVYSPETGEQYSARVGDYFIAEPAEALVDNDGNAMVLALVKPAQIEPIRSIVTPGEDEPGRVSDAAVGIFVRQCVSQGWTSVEIGRAARKLTA